MRRLAALSLGLARAAPAAAEVPPGELVMLDVYNWDTVTDQVEPSNERLGWREIIDAGINGVHFRPWHWAHDGG